MAATAWLKLKRRSIYAQVQAAKTRSQSEERVA